MADDNDALRREMAEAIAAWQAQTPGLRERPLADALLAGLIGRLQTRISELEAERDEALELLERADKEREELVAARTASAETCALIEKGKLLIAEARISELEAERDGAQRDVIDMTWQRRRANERAEDAESRAASSAEEMREACVKIASDEAIWRPYWNGQPIGWAIASAIRALLAAPQSERETGR